MTSKYFALALLTAFTVACKGPTDKPAPTTSTSPAAVASVSASPSATPAEASGMSKTFEKTMELQGHTFKVTCTNGSPPSKLTIETSGLSEVTEPMIQELEGYVYGAEVADLDANGFPEVYIYAQSPGSGSYGNLVAYASNKGKSISPISLAPLSEKASVGYQGHDEFSVVELSLGRRFPIYLEGDSNAKATGGLRQIEYKLEPGEATWQLVEKNIQDIPSS